MRLCSGYEIVCPDGRVRHYPYHNEGDADCDARVHSERVCRTFHDDPPEWNDPPCPQGNHTVRAILLVHGDDTRGVA